VILACILLAVIVSVLLIRYLPKSYRSSSLLLVENQKIPESYVKGTVGGSIEQRLMLIQQQVMSGTLLTQIIEELE